MVWTARATGLNFHILLWAHKQNTPSYLQLSGKLHPIMFTVWTAYLQTERYYHIVRWTQKQNTTPLLHQLTQVASNYVWVWTAYVRTKLCYPIFLWMQKQNTTQFLQLLRKSLVTVWAAVRTELYLTTYCVENRIKIRRHFAAVTQVASYGMNRVRANRALPYHILRWTHKQNTTPCYYFCNCYAGCILKLMTSFSELVLFCPSLSLPVLRVSPSSRL